MFVKTNYLIQKARKEGYAVGCFVIYNLETALAVTEAAVEARSPVIIAVSEFTITFTGLETISQIVINLAKHQGVSVPIALHLDHGRSFESVKACVDEGFSSVQIDGSHLPFRENVTLTKEVVEYAHLHKIWVEGELGAIYGGHGGTGEFKGEIPLVKPNEVNKFIDQTEVDLLAAALGTVHGKFSNERINFDLLKQIRGITDTPLVLHGTSGLPDAEIQKAVKAGISKVNIGTETKRLFVDSLRETLQKNPELEGPRELLKPTIAAIKKMAVEKFQVLGSANKI